VRRSRRGGTRGHKARQDNEKPVVSSRFSVLSLFLQQLRRAGYARRRLYLSLGADRVIDYSRWHGQLFQPQKYWLTNPSLEFIL